MSTRPSSLKRTLRICHYLASSTKNRLKFSLGKIDSHSGSYANTITVEQAVAYLELQYSEWLQYGPLTPADIEGKVFVELGPGDNIGVLLMLLAAGAKRCYAADKFASTHDVEHERKIYLKLRESLSPDAQARLDAAVTLSPRLEFNPDKVTYVVGKGAQHIDQLVPHGSVDWVISRGVLQEVYAIDQAFAAIDRILKPGGGMIHKIDQRDYGMFSSLGFHPREFLTISDVVYAGMAANTDKPNRRMLNYYRAKMKSMRYEFQIYLAGIIVDKSYSGMQPEIKPHPTSFRRGVHYHDADQKLIEEIRPRLAPAFRDMTDQDLLATAFFLSGRKPTSRS